MMAEESDDFPKSCDVLILGTGLVESIVGAACSRIGKKVVVLDRNRFYGGDWATFSYKHLKEWVAHRLVSDLEPNLSRVLPLSLQSDEIAFDVPMTNDSSVTHISYWSYSREEDQNVVEVCTEVTNPDDSTSNSEENSEKQSNISKQLEVYEKLEKFGNRFNISLCPKFLIARAKLVKLLVESAISRYCEFLALHDLSFLYNSKLEKVPSSRADVFKNTLITLQEKRQMMRLLEFCLSHDFDSTSQEQLEMKFTAYLQSVHAVSERLSQIIVLHVLYESIESRTKQCLAKLRVFCESLGVYSNSPYLYTMYGVGELPQCFARLNAIFGGTFVLGSQDAAAKLIVRTPRCVSRESFLTDSSVNLDQMSLEQTDAGSPDEQVSSEQRLPRVKGVMTASGRVIACDHLVCEPSYVPVSILPAFTRSKRSYLRAIFITNRRLDATKDSSVALISIPPPLGRKHPLRLMEETPQSCATSEGFNILQAITEDEDANASPKDQIDAYVKGLLKPFSISDEEEQQLVPQVLLSLYFRYNLIESYDQESEEHTSGEDNSLKGRPPCFDNLHITCGPNSDIGFDSCVKQAEFMFSKICPDEEFLPRAPDPEDVIIGGTMEDSGTLTSSNQSEPVPDTIEPSGTEIVDLPENKEFSEISER